MPMAAFLGGDAGQEVLKACTGKFAPVVPVSYRIDGVGAGRHRATHGRGPRGSRCACHDCLEALPESTEYTPKNDKNDSVRVVFGNDMVAKLAKLNYFRRQSAAGPQELGLDRLGRRGMAILVTHGPHREVTCRHVISESDIGHEAREPHSPLKTEPLINVEGVEKRVGADSEDVFDDKFWSR